MNHRSIISIFILLVTFAFLSGCVGTRTSLVDGYEIQEVYSIGLFTPTVQMTRMSKCTLKEIHHSGKPHGTPWIENVTTGPCIIIGTAKDGFIQNSAGPVGPVLLNGAATVGGAMIINDGLRNQNVSPGDNIEINNNNSQAQGQAQGQLQGQSQKSINSNRNTNRNTNNNRNNNQNRGRGRGHGGD